MTTQHRRRKLMRVVGTDGVVRYDLLDSELLKDIVAPGPGQEKFQFPDEKDAPPRRGADAPRDILGRPLHDDTPSERYRSTMEIDPRRACLAADGSMTALPYTPRVSPVSIQTRTDLAEARALHKTGGWSAVRERFAQNHTVKCDCGRDGIIQPDPILVKLLANDRPEAICNECRDWKDA